MKWRGLGAKEIKWPGRRGRMGRNCYTLQGTLHQFGAQEDPAAPIASTRCRVTTSFFKSRGHLILNSFIAMYCQHLRDKVEPRCQLLGALPVPEKILPCCFYVGTVYGG